MTDFEARKTIWATLGRLFAPDEGVELWLFSAEDMIAANTMPDGTGCYHGVVRGVEP
jgi:hypothetical protein